MKWNLTTDLGPETLWDNPGGGGLWAAGPLVGPAVVGSGAGGGATVGAPRGRQQQHTVEAGSKRWHIRLVLSNLER